MVVLCLCAPPLPLPFIGFTMFSCMKHIYGNALWTLTPLLLLGLFPFVFISPSGRLPAPPTWFTRYPCDFQDATSDAKLVKVFASDKWALVKKCKTCSGGLFWNKTSNTYHFRKSDGQTRELTGSSLSRDKVYRNLDQGGAEHVDWIPQGADETPTTNRGEPTAMSRNLDVNVLEKYVKVMNPPCTVHCDQRCDRMFLNAQYVFTYSRQFIRVPCFLTRYAESVVACPAIPKKGSSDFCAPDPRPLQAHESVATLCEYKQPVRQYVKRMYDDVTHPEMCRAVMQYAPIMSVR